MESEQRKNILELITILTDQHLTEIEVEQNDLRIRVRREPPVAPHSAHQSVALSAPQPTHVPDATTESIDVNLSQFLTVASPIVGTFYRSPSPDADFYVEEGSVVRKGQVLCVVEAMKLMNEIEAEADGRIVRVLVENGTGIEYGQSLFLIEPLPVT